MKDSLSKANDLEKEGENKYKKVGIRNLQK